MTLRAMVAFKSAGHIYNPSNNQDILRGKFDPHTPANNSPAASTMQGGVELTVFHLGDWARLYVKIREGGWGRRCKWLN